MPSNRRCARCTFMHVPRCPETLWPLQPLLDLLRTSPYDVLHVSGAELERRLVEGLPDLIADRWAIKAGFHPAQVWPDWTDAGLSVVDRAFLESGWRHAWLADEEARVAS